MSEEHQSTMPEPSETTTPSSEEKVETAAADPVGETATTTDQEQDVDESSDAKEAAAPEAVASEKTDPKPAEQETVVQDEVAAAPKAKEAIAEEATPKPKAKEAVAKKAAPKPEAKEAVAKKAAPKPKAKKAVAKKAAPKPEAKKATATPEAKDETVKADSTKKASPKDKKKPAPQAQAPVDPVLAKLMEARDQGTTIQGKVFGWNDKGFHVVIEGLTAFCPGSEMAIGRRADREQYRDKEMDFKVLRVQKKNKRVVISRAAIEKESRKKHLDEIIQGMNDSKIFKGEVTSLTDFGAFVDLGNGIEGMVHVSEIGHQRLDKPSDVLEEGQEVEVKILSVENKGRRLSLSMKVLHNDPWGEVKKKYPVGAMVKGKVEKTAGFGAFVELEEGLTGLLPTSAMAIPPGSNSGRVYPPGKEVDVLISSVDLRRRRISLSLQGSALEGSRSDFMNFQKSQDKAKSGGMSAMAAAFAKVKPKG